MKKTISISVFLFIALSQQSIAKRSPQLSCKIPFSPSTRSTPVYGRNHRFQGNCRVHGDRGVGICHAPNEAHKSISILKNRNKHDSLFLKTQRSTGLSWKLIKSFVYQETSLIEKYLNISKITSGDGLGVGYMQLTRRAMPNEIRFYNKHFKSIYNINISKTSIGNNKLHHMVLGVSWLLHKFKIRTKWSSSKLKSFFSVIYHDFREKNDGWGFKQVKNDAFMNKKLKEAVTAYNGLGSRCIVNGKVLTAYGDHVEYYYYSLIKGSDMPIPYVESDNEVENMEVEEAQSVPSVGSYSSRATKHNYSSKNESGEEVILEDDQSGYNIGIGVSI